MRLACAPLGNDLLRSTDIDGAIVLFGHADEPDRASVGAAVADAVRRAGLLPTQRSWDFLAIALSVVAADIVVRRDGSADGWTREIALDVAVTEPEFWNARCRQLESLLGFLTTDLWTLRVVQGGAEPSEPRKSVRAEQDCILLLSGGLDSLVGAIDLESRGKVPFVVSQIARGDGERQRRFARRAGAGMRHLQLNHNATSPRANERSQRARSLAFFAYGVLAASTLRRYAEGEVVPLFACENGFISINPPLTPGRLGSLSTRTTHPVFLKQLQELLDAAELRVHLENPYQFKTKGEMLAECKDQTLLTRLAHTSTSCGRFARNGYRHCGRCVPCMIRRAAFQRWGVRDSTEYVYADLRRDDDDYARFDDVRSAAMAIAQVKFEGLSVWLGTSISSALIGDPAPYRSVVERGFGELEVLLRHAGVR